MSTYDTVILRSAQLRASRRMEGVPDLFPYLWPFMAQAPPAHFGGDETALAPPLFAGTTGEFCFAAPPTAVGFFGPPRAVCAETGCDRANAPRTTTSAARIIAPFFIDASFRVTSPTGSWLGFPARLLAWRQRRARAVIPRGKTTATRSRPRPSGRYRSSPARPARDWL